MIRRSMSHVSLTALALLSLPLMQASAQQQVPAAPANAQAAPAQPAAAPVQVPAAPAPAAAPVFPKPDPKNFTAAAPTKETVDAFLTANWGYDDQRIWQVQAILKTPVPDVSKVVVFVGDKTGKERPSALVFFTMPDGKHIIAGNDVVPFGSNPFADTRAMVEQRADGPYRGNAEKNLEIVEFADFQCPHCKEAQTNMDQLAVDFPQARIVYQNDPIAAIHPEAERAAEYGVCVDKLGGSSAFFKFATEVFNGQDGLATADGATLTLNNAVVKAGLDTAKVAACAALPETRTKVDNSVKLASDLGINSTPTLVVNGREIPANIPYATLKRIIQYQAKLDGATQK